MSRRDIAKEWVKQHGLAVWVLLAAVAAVILAVSVSAPGKLPALAQGSAALWRVEQFGFSFVILYAVIRAVAWSFVAGAKGDDLVQEKQQEALEGQAETLDAIREEAEISASLTQVAVDHLSEQMKELEQRLEELEGDF